LNILFKVLFSGFRLNSAANDAASLHILDRLTSPVQGLNQAVSNAVNAVSLTQMTKGVLGEVANLILLISLANQRLKSVLLLIN
jgi:flagellin-like hook-associated protein FlgL